MPPEASDLLDPEKVDEVRRWLVKAQEDLSAADLTAHHLPPLLSSATFHAQQAAEKALKAFLVWHDTPFRYTHNLVGLTAQCAGIDGAFAILNDAADLLTPYAVRFRYPSDLTGPTVSEVEAALQAAREVVAFVRARLPVEAQPAGL